MLVSTSALAHSKMYVQYISIYIEDVHVPFFAAKTEPSIGKILTSNIHLTLSRKVEVGDAIHSKNAVAHI